MPTILLIVYRVLGTVLFALAAAALWKIPHGPRGRAAARPRAGMPPCVIHQQQPGCGRLPLSGGAVRQRSAAGAGDERRFWFRHDKDKGKVLQVWYNPNARCVERKSWETEFFAAVLAVIGAALLLIR